MNQPIPYKFETLPAGSWQWTGRFDQTIRFIQEQQLKNSTVWKILVDQFRRGNADDENMGWRGEYWGKMMRGAALTYTYTRDTKLYRILEETVLDLLSTQDSAGRFSTYSVTKELQEWDVWCRKYVMLGLQYFLDICEDNRLRQQILSALTRHADYILDHVGNGAGKKRITQTSLSWDGLNSSSILEPFVRLFLLTGLQKYLDFSKHIIDNGGLEGFPLFETAWKDNLYPYEYPVTKAYEMMSCFEGLLWYYRATGEEKYLRTTERFVDRIMKSDITIIGSAGCTHELFDHSRINQFDPAYQGIMQETCVTVTWMKLCYLLLQITGKAKYAEAMERSAYNALLGAVNTENCQRHGMVPAFDSYSPLRKGVRGKAIGGFQWLTDKFAYGCCIAIGAAGTALTALAACSRLKDGFAFHLYQAGTIQTISPLGNPLSFVLEGQYPEEERIEITIHIAQPENMNLSFRLPSFGAGSKLMINGKEIAADGLDGFLTVSRKWEDGDSVIILTDLPIILLRDSDILPEAAERPVRYGALLRGPIVLALDARCDSNNLDIPLDFESGCFSEKHLTEFDRFPVKQAYSISCSGKPVIFVDYASCGKTWEEEFPMAAWFSMKE